MNTSMTASKTNKPGKPGTRSRGFSLVEVTLAVGIAAFGLISVMALVPQGFEMSRKTGELTVQRHIVEQIFRELEQASFASIVQGERTRYFDDQGVELSAQGSGGMITYVANVTVEPLTTVLSAGSGPEQYLRKVTLKIATTTTRTFDFSDGNSARYARFFNYIAKSR